MSHDCPNSILAKYLDDIFMLPSILETTVNSLKLIAIEQHHICCLYTSCGCKFFLNETITEQINYNSSLRHHINNNIILNNELAYAVYHNIIDLYLDNNYNPVNNIVTSNTEAINNLIDATNENTKIIYIAQHQNNILNSTNILNRNLPQVYNCNTLFNYNYKQRCLINSQEIVTALDKIRVLIEKIK